VSSETTRSKVQLDFSGLVERLVPLVAELFATLAAQDPLKMSFAGIAGKTLLDLVEVMQRDGMSQETIAATLGMTIGGFRTKLKKLREVYRASEVPAGGTRSRTLLEQVFAFIDETARATGKEVPFRALADRFQGVHDDTLRGVLKFLVGYELLEAAGRGQRRGYRVAKRRVNHDSSLPEVSVILFREGPMTLEQLCKRTGRSESSCLPLLQQLREDGSLEEIETRNGSKLYRVSDYHIPVGMTAGYEVAILDHVTAMCAAVCKKVRLGRHEATLADLHGGTTFSFDVPVGHPLEAEIASFLATARVQMENWLEQSRAASRDEPNRAQRRITIYTGQMVEDV
jgi:hypothetical protein